MKVITILLFLSFSSFIAAAQFPPPAGQLGTTAIHKDSSVFVAWATDCIVVRGPQDISSTVSAMASAGEDWMAIGKAGSSGTVSLGDGGYATVTFEYPIYNGTGWDFAVFENGFSDSFLELAFVEVSSDGINFFRFPPTSLTQDSLQIDAFGALDATKIDNFAGKYRVHYGTPFDLEELKDINGLDINAITHIKIIDVVGSIHDAFATYDQHNNKINDPWPTVFASGGFDLDAVGVINATNTKITEKSNPENFSIYPNPVKDFATIIIHSNTSAPFSVSISDLQGRTIYFYDTNLYGHFIENLTIDFTTYKAGIYFITLNGYSKKSIKKIIKLHD